MLDGATEEARLTPAVMLLLLLLLMLLLLFSEPGAQQP